MGMTGLIVVFVHDEKQGSGHHYIVAADGMRANSPPASLIGARMVF